jgi:hypothetical protein
MTIYEEAMRVLEYDPETGIVRHRITHGRAKAGTIAGTRRCDGYSVIWVDGKLHLMHRVIYLMMTKEWPAQQIDHINRDPSDNRWCNLRAASPRENIMNRGALRLNRRNTSGAAGIHYMSKLGKWCSRIHIDGKRHYLGIFDTKDEAVRVRHDRLRELTGASA